MKKILLTPGPTETPRWLRWAIASYSLHHRDQEYWPITEEVRQDMRELFGAPKAEILIFRGGGTEMMEAVVANFLLPNDRVLIINTGFFADRWREIVEEYSNTVKILECKSDWGYSYDLSCVIPTLERYTPKLVLMQLTETSTGVKNQCLNLARIIRRSSPSALLAIDAVLEAAVSPIKMFLEEIDILIGSSQKAFMLSPALGFALVNSRALEYLQSTAVSFPAYAHNFRKEIKALGEGRVRFTPPTEHIAGLHVVLNHILREKGEYQWYEGHRLRAEFVRAKLAELGFTLFTKHSPSNGLSVFSLPSGQNASRLKENLEDRGFKIERGLDKYRDSVIRVAHFAGVEDIYILHFVETLKEIMETES